MSEAMLQLVADDNLRGQLAKASYKRACDEFSIERMVERYQQVYDGH